MNRIQNAAGSAPRWLLNVAPDAPLTTHSQPLLGILPGEGCGPELTAAALRVLAALEESTGLRITHRTGGDIGLTAPGSVDGSLTSDTADFCREIFRDGGAILAGPAGGRFVYDLRRAFNFFCKLAPLQPEPALFNSNRLRPDALRHVDILVVRDNAGGLYQGEWSDRSDPDLGRIAEQSFSCTEAQVRAIIAAGARLAATRRKRMHVVIKDGGVPTISNLWKECAVPLAAEYGVHLHCINADHAAYRLIQHPREFDVLVTPNMVGDILADLGAVLLGSRGLSYSGNFSALGHAVYQTGHGAAYDLAGADRVNPVAHLLAMAMLLRESFDRPAEAALIEHSIQSVWRAGWRTEDLAEPDCSVAGTQQFAELIAAAILTRTQVPVTP